MILFGLFNTKDYIIDYYVSYSFNSSLNMLINAHLFVLFKDHVYELLNTIDACQCFFNIVSDTEDFLKALNNAVVLSLF